MIKDEEENEEDREGGGDADYDGVLHTDVSVVVSSVSSCTMKE